MKTIQAVLFAFSAMLLSLVSIGAHAKQISYDMNLNGFIYHDNQDIDYFAGTGHVVFDAEKFAIVDFFVDEGPLQIDWQGVEPLSSEFLHNGPDDPQNEVTEILRGNAGTSWFLYLTRPLNVNPLEYLDQLSGKSEFYFYDISGTNTAKHFVYTRFENKTYLVPEPATLSLLFLGLAAIGIRRRLRYS